MNHTNECDTRWNAQLTWRQQWPAFCRKCGARGHIHNPGDPPSDELCHECLGKPRDPNTPCGCGCGLPIGDLDLTDDCGHCPRCGKHGIYVANLDPNDAIEYPSCGWAGGAGADDHLPEMDCTCEEDLVWTTDRRFHLGEGRNTLAHYQTWTEELVRFAELLQNTDYIFDCEH